MPYRGFITSSRLSRSIAAGLVAATLLAACSGGSSTLMPIVKTPSTPGAPSAAPTATAAATPAKTASPMPTTSAPTSTIGTATTAGAIALPAGSTLAPGTLTVSNALGSAPVSTTGAFVLATASEGPQFTVVSDANGNPVLYGFFGPGSTTIDATSSAKALVYFAAAFYMLPSPYRGQIVDQIATVPGFATVVSTFAATVAQNPDALGSQTTAAPVAAALTAFSQSFFSTTTPSALARRTAALIRKRFAIVVNPSDAHSGITVVNDFPNGVHFDNAYRRVAKAFVDEVSYVDTSGNVFAKPVTDVAAPVSIPAVGGLGNLTSSLVSTVQGLYTGATAYTPIDTSTVPLPLEPGASRTRYQITVVGAGKPAANALTAEQRSAQQILGVQQLVQDIFVPLVLSFVIPLNDTKIDGAFNFDGANGVLGDFIGNLTTAAPQIADLMNQGSVADALQLAVNTLATSNTLQAALLQVATDQLRNAVGTDITEAALAKGQKLLAVLNVASAVTVGFDVGVVSANIASSNESEVFTVDVTDDKVTLAPATASITSAQTQTFTANVPSASGSGETIVWHWHSTTNAGTITDGLAGHSGDFDSSRNAVVYTPIAQGSGSDTITATAFLVSGQDRVQIGNPISATITVRSTINFTLSWGPAVPPQTTLLQLTGGGTFTTNDDGISMNFTDDGYDVYTILADDGVQPSSVLGQQTNVTGTVPKSIVGGVDHDETESLAPNEQALEVDFSTPYATFVITKVLAGGMPLPLPGTPGTPCTMNCVSTVDGAQYVDIVFPDYPTLVTAGNDIQKWLGEPPTFGTPQEPMRKKRRTSARGRR